MLTKPDRERGEHDHLWPEFLPGGRSVLFTITAAASDITNAQIAVLDLRTLTSKVLIRGGSDAHYVPTGHLVYGAAGTLRAVGFDLERLEVTGTPTPVLEGVATSRAGGAEVAVCCERLARLRSRRCRSRRSADRRLCRSSGTCLSPSGPFHRLVPRPSSIARRRAARPGHPGESVDLRSHPRDADPADHRGQCPQPALDARRNAPHLFIEPLRISRAVLAAGRRQRGRRVAARAREQSHELCAPTTGRQTASTSCLPKWGQSRRSGRWPSIVRRT